MVEQRPDDWAFGSGGYARIFGHRLANSSLLDCDVATRWVFVWMLSQADAQGRVRCATVSALARAANVTDEQAQLAIDELSAPDPRSTTKSRKGKRIIPIRGGWQIVAYTRYREYKTKKQIEDAARKAKSRAKKRGKE